MDEPQGFSILRGLRVLANKPLVTGDITESVGLIYLQNDGSKGEEQMYQQGYCVIDSATSVRAL